MTSELHKHPKTLLVIFAEAALEKRLVQDAQRLGAHGYTVWDVRGGSGLDERKGGQSMASVRSGSWDNDRTIEMKLICSPEVADSIAAHVLQQYGQDFSVTLYFAQVQVLRSEKF
jgi:nitrogen regulatory protein P-II 2